jgi:S-adenosylmethionine decarboxylase
VHTRGVEYVVDATGCPANALRSPARLRRLFDALVRELGLHPIGRARWHRFPGPGGITGVWMLRESHLAIHTFPEHGSLCLNLFCCRPRPAWAWETRLAELLGAQSVAVRRLEREYGPSGRRTNRRARRVRREGRALPGPGTPPEGPSLFGRAGGGAGALRLSARSAPSAIRERF